MTNLMNAGSMYFDAFRDASFRVLAQSGNCKESQQMLGAATCSTELAAAWRHFWQGVVDEVPQQAIAAFEQCYKDNKDAINAAGLYFNESPKGNGNIVLVGCETGERPEVTVTGRQNVYALGYCVLDCEDDSSVVVAHEKAIVSLHGTCRCVLRSGTVFALGHSYVYGTGQVECGECASVRIVDGVCNDHGHSKIQAFGNAVVRSDSDYKILLHDNAKLIIE